MVAFRYTTHPRSAARRGNRQEAASYHKRRAIDRRQYCSASHTEVATVKPGRQMKTLDSGRGLRGIVLHALAICSRPNQLTLVYLREVAHSPLLLPSTVSVC